jgi:hypothetical protein
VDDPSAEIPHVRPLKQIAHVPSECDDLPGRVDPRIEPHKRALQLLDDLSATRNGCVGRAVLRRAKDGGVDSSAEREEQVVQLQTKVGNKNLTRRSGGPVSMVSTCIQRMKKDAPVGPDSS